LHQITNVGVSRLSPSRSFSGQFGREIIFQEFKPMWSRYLNVTNGQTDDMLWYNCALRSVASRGKNLGFFESIFHFPAPHVIVLTYLFISKAFYDLW